MLVVRLNSSKRNVQSTWVHSVFAAALIAGAGSSCGGEVALPKADSHGGIEDEDASPGDLETNDESAPGAQPDVIEAPGRVVVDYPAGPYGTKLGAIIENLELFGWRNPVEANFDLDRAETIRFSDYYNAQGAVGVGVEYILLNVVASWCGVCRSEYTHLAEDDVYAALAPRGLQIVGVLYEDNNSDPSRFVDMSNWAQAFSVSFPFVNDPGFKTGRYFDRSATPMNMLIDARTMQIVEVGTGYRPAMFDEIDVLLQGRGR